MNEINIDGKKQKKVAINLIIFFILPIILLLFGIIYVIIESNFITTKVVKNTVFDCFNVGKPYYPINGINDAGDGYLMISANADNQIVAMEQLKNVYHKLSKKISIGKIDKVSITIYAPDKQTILLTSDIWIKDLKATNWLAINKYDDFIDKADIILK
ncbi:hypothetical protein CS063_13815 [Sporanaerobium hydrogeniformans]|uniref:Uncharacterized protein n=1 Tax=Sporanaerobium hydrogeniformans TaxID=3072179 RepID=A0AC61DAK1_9FIRM|nr:hypothetical protein [Sporanaerobium hydrogeniformans]PHV69790.1 hypothetical protein CS063_13815 [Sporanaerobium hydrogeniformans]